MENEVWSEISAFLNNLRCAEMWAESLIFTSRNWKKQKRSERQKKQILRQRWESWMQSKRQQIENYFEAVQHSGIYGRRTGILSRICGLYSVVRWLGDAE